MSSPYEYKILNKELSCLTDETIKSLNDLGDVLLCIHRRILAEGLMIEDGKIIKNDEIKF